LERKALAVLASETLAQFYSIMGFFSLISSSKKLNFLSELAGGHQFVKD
jgi:hypothetical protein